MTEQSKISENVKDIETNKCVLIKNLLSDDLCKFLSTQAEIDELDENSSNSRQVSGSVEIYDSVATKITNNIVLHKLKDTLKLQKIYTTYGFYRKYYKYQELVKHTDRPECELSVSICLNMSEKNKPWGLFFENTEQDCIYVAEPHVGDAVIYMGMDLPHWREPCEHNWLKQLFLHYTLNKELEFDLKNTPHPEVNKLFKTFIKVMNE